MKLIEKIEDLRIDKYYLEYDKTEFGHTVSILKCSDIRAKLFDPIWVEGTLVDAVTCARGRWSLEPYTLYYSDDESAGEYILKPDLHPTFELTDDEVYNILALTI